MPRVNQTPDKGTVISPPARRTRSARKKRGIELAGAEPEPAVAAVATPNAKATPKAKSTPKTKTESTPLKTPAVQKKVSLPPLPRSSRPPRKPTAQEDVAIKTPSRRSARKAVLQKNNNNDSEQEDNTKTPVRRSTRKKQKVDDEEMVAVRAEQQEQQPEANVKDAEEAKPEPEAEPESESDPTIRIQTPQEKAKPIPSNPKHSSRKKKDEEEKEEVVKAKATPASKRSARKERKVEKEDEETVLETQNSAGSMKGVTQQSANEEGDETNGLTEETKSEAEPISTPQEKKAKTLTSKRSAKKVVAVKTNEQAEPESQPEPILTPKEKAQAEPSRRSRKKREKLVEQEQAVKEDHQSDVDMKDVSEQNLDEKDVDQKDEPAEPDSKPEQKKARGRVRGSSSRTKRSRRKRQKIESNSNEETHDIDMKDKNKVESQHKKLKPEAKPTTPQMNVQVHRFRCINYIPKPILRLCATPFSPNNSSSSFHMPHLAISREGGSVELVSPNEKWKCISIIEGMKHRPIDAMAWICESDGTKEKKDEDIAHEKKGYFCKRHAEAETCMSQRKLIGASRDGTMMELDFHSKTQKGVMGSGGGAVFCLVGLCGGYVAAGCEDGSVRIYRSATAANSDNNDLDNAPCLELVSTLPSVGAAVLSIAWLPGIDGTLKGSVIYVGVADGTIRKMECTSSSDFNSSRSNYNPHAMSTGYVFDQSTSLQWKASLRMTVENRGRRTATKIWALKALNDGTVISGDSMGNVQFWDGKYGTLMQSMEHNPHNADVLDVAVSLDENKVMASGIDSKVVCIERIPFSEHGRMKGGERPKQSKWVMTHQQRSHTHDVCSLAMVYTTDHADGSFGSVASSLTRAKKMNAAGTDITSNTTSACNHKELLCSGGVDTKVCSYFVANMKKYRAQIAYKYPTSAPIALSRLPRLLSIMRSDKIDFYHLCDEANAMGAQDEERAYLGSVSIQSSHNLISFDVSQDGKYLAVSNAAGLLLFQLDLVDTFDENGDATKIIVPKEIKFPANTIVASAPCSRIKFGKDGLLVCATTRGPIHLLQLGIQGEDDDGAKSSDNSAMTVKLSNTLTKHMESSSSIKKLPISQLTISSDGRWLAVGRNAFGNGSIEVFSIGNSKQQHWWTLPCTEVPHSCINFIGDDNLDPALAVACNNGVVYLFDVEQRRLSDWSEDLGFPAGPNLPDELGLCSDCPDTLAYNKATPNKFVMGGHTWFTSIDLSSPVPIRSKPFPENHFKAKKWKKKFVKDRQRSESFSDKEKKSLKRDDQNKNFTICLRYSGIIFQDFLDDNEMVVVEQPWLGIVNTLPDALERQRYGS